MSSSTRSSQGAIESVNGSPRYVGAISATTNVDSLAVSRGTTYMVQPSADVYVSAATADDVITKSDGTTATLTTALGYFVEANEKYFITTRMDETFFSAITGSGTSTVKLFIME